MPFKGLFHRSSSAPSGATTYPRRVCRRFRRRCVELLGLLGLAVVLGACTAPGLEPRLSGEGGAVIRLPEALPGTQLIGVDETWISQIDGQPVDRATREVRVSPGEHSVVVSNRRCGLPVLFVTCWLSETTQQRTLLFTAFPGGSYAVELEPMRIRDLRDDRVVSLY